MPASLMHQALILTPLLLALTAAPAPAASTNADTSDAAQTG
jgi:hypothetical protein